MENNIISFGKALESAGYKPARALYGDTGAKWERLYYGDEKRTSGRYRYFDNGEIAYGVFGSDKDPMGFSTWRSWDGQKLTDEEYKAAQQWQREQREKVRKREESKQDRLAQRLTRHWKRSRMAAVPPDHPYLVEKNIQGENIKHRQQGNEIIVPCISPEDSRMYGYQRIMPNGTKLFVKGSVIKGMFCPLAKTGESNKRIYICEGYATGMTIRKATGHKVFVAFNAGNLVHVAQALHDKWPDTEIIIAADNDKYPSEKWPKNKKWVNTGLEKAKHAAGKVGGFVLAPEFDEDCDAEQLRLTDWNDYACVYGINKVQELLLAPSHVTSNSEQEAEDNSSLPVASPKGESSLPAHARFSINEDNWIDHLRWKDGVEGTIFDTRFSIHNGIIYLTFDPMWAGTFVYDEFQQIERVIKPLPWDDPNKFKWRDVDANDKTELRGLLQTRGINIGSNTEMGNVITSAARKKTIHPVRSYFDYMEWDGVKRLDTWLIKYCEATEQPKEYLEAVGSCFLKASVKRIYNAGEPFHHMLVLEGKQAAGKSSLLKELATLDDISFFTDGVGFDDIGNKHTAQFLRGKLIIEFAELSGLSNKDRNRVKSWITQDTDEVMPKFSNDVVKWPRQFVLAGSTNDEGWLNDPTGGRRFWPVKVGKIDIEGIKRVKNQLWAEAIHRVKAGEMHFIPDDSPVYKLAQDQQSERYEGHVWQGQIEGYLNGRDEILIDEILEDCLFVPKAQWKNYMKSEIGDILRTMGWENKPVYDRGTKKMVRKWVKG